MSQEITVLVIVDVQGALESNSLKGNIYLIDNLRTEGSTGLGTGDLTSAANSSHWSDGSQAYEPLFNWLPYPITAFPPAIGRNAKAKIAQKGDATTHKAALDLVKNIDAIYKSRGSTDNRNVKIKDILGESIDDIHQNKGIRIIVKDSNGKKQDTGLKLMNRKGELISASEAEMSTVGYLNHLTPQINNITGEAVDKGILYPAQYGTPILIKDGWYWSGTVSTFKPGIYSYTLHITLYRLENLNLNNRESIWKPAYFTHDARIKVSSIPMRNGFTKAGLWYLPVT